MKKIIATIIIIALAQTGHAQTPAESLSHKMAQRMKDSLALSETQQSQIFQVNMSLHQQKMAVRQLYNHSDSMRVHIQAIENSRDSLYKPFLTEAQFQGYRQKKKNIVRN